MSYEIVKNIRVEKNQDNDFYHVRIKSACNNVYPHYYSEGTYGEKYNWTKQEAEKSILLDFLHGNLQGGSSRYRKAVKGINKEELKQYYRLDRIYSKASSRCWKRYDRNNKENKNYVQACALADKLRDMRDREAKEVLYNYMVTHSKDINATKVEPFVIIEKSSGAYVVKVTKTRFFTSPYRTAHTSKTLWDRVHDSKWWNDWFIIEQINKV